MRIGIYCPLGPLDRFGYQHVFRGTLQSISRAADRVYFLSTTRNRAYADEVLRLCPNALLVSNESTWFSVDSHGREVFDPARPVEANASLAVELAKRDGMDCMAQVHVNQYVSVRAAKALHAACRRQVDARSPIGWLYHRYQLRDRLFRTESRRPWVVNLHADPTYLYAIDSARDPDHMATYRWEHGDFRAMDACALVDLPLELTIAELEEKMNFVRCYADVNPAADRVFSWDRFYRYYVTKFRLKTLTRDHPADCGAVFSARSRPDFVSWAVLDAVEGRRGRIARRLLRGMAGLA